MHPIQITPTAAAWNAADDTGEPTAPGWYCYEREDDEWHGPFEDYAEACDFVRYCDNQARLDERHARTCKGMG